MYIEADIDFSEDEIESLSSQETQEHLSAAQNTLNRLLDRARPGVLLRQGAKVVLAGAPNAGKSSVMNALAGANRAIVSDQPGTTRDLVESEIDLDGLPVRLVDTAGLRYSDDQVESEGVRRAKDAMATADLVLLVIDDAVESQLTEQAPTIVTPANTPILYVHNKCDLSRRPYGSAFGAKATAVAVSAAFGGGIDNLLEAIKILLGYSYTTENPLIARRRHLVALKRVDRHLRAASDQVGGPPELLAEELRLAQAALGEITGAIATEDLLGQIFSSFCIGK